MLNGIKYIVDEQGKRKEVVVPLRLWSTLVERERKRPAAKHINKRKVMDRKRLKAYQGTITLPVDPLKFQKAMRNEWR